MWMDGEGGGGREYPVEMDATTEEISKLIEEIRQHRFSKIVISGK